MSLPFDRVVDLEHLLRPTDADLAAHIRADRSLISRYERGCFLPRPDRLRRYAAALERLAAELAGNDDQHPPPRLAAEPAEDDHA